ncbi:MAG: hypothetical protein LQ351_007683 [Letrouitia transgressa]|nr:MAG: hypothetical protein LQ351_007683 [Letrouitia transgressa]
MASPANLVKAPQDWLIQQICNWIAHPINNAHIREAMSSRGGWEAWLQLELLFELRALVIAFDISNTVDRERSPIWPDSPKDRIDFWFTWNALDANQELRQHWRLELKRRSKAESHDSFNERVFGGIGKLASYDKIIRPATGSFYEDRRSFYIIDEEVILTFLPQQSFKGIETLTLDSVRSK